MKFSISIPELTIYGVEILQKNLPYAMMIPAARGIEVGNCSGNCADWWSNEFECSMEVFIVF